MVGAVVLQPLYYLHSSMVSVVMGWELHVVAVAEWPISQPGSLR